MKTVVLGLPALMFIAGTRAALGLGIGLLVSSRLPEARRRTLGTVLVAIGALTTVPAARSVLRQVRSDTRATGRDARLIGATRFPRKGDDELM